MSLGPRQDSSAGSAGQLAERACWIIPINRQRSPGVAPAGSLRRLLLNWFDWLSWPLPMSVGTVSLVGTVGLVGPFEIFL